MSILEKLNCKWWLTAGTCLGAIRNNDFISWDLDIDIGLDEKHIELWETLIKEFQRAEFSYYKGWEYKGKKTELSFMRYGIKVDLFFFFRKDEFYWHGVFGPNEKGQWGKYMILYPNVFSAFLFSNLKEIFFHGIRCFVPYPTEQYLKERYGDDWRAPDEDYKYWECKAIDKTFLEEERDETSI